MKWVNHHEQARHAADTDEARLAKLPEHAPDLAFFVRREGRALSLRTPPGDRAAVCGGGSLSVGDDPERGVDDGSDQRHHDLNSSLTTIAGRAYLLGRAIRRASGLGDEEQARMLESVAAIESAAWTLVAVVESIGEKDRRR